MQIEKKLARLIYPELRFSKMTLKDASDLVDMGVGGFCIYGGSRDEIYSTVKALKARADYPLLFAADYENGTGQWIKEGTLLPSNMAIASAGESFWAKRKAQITAAESLAMGVQWVFAPVADMATEHENPIVNLRAFSDNPHKVIEFCSDYMDGLSSMGALSSVKHFPGHGDTSVDSHLALPAINKSFSELENLELKPFKALMSKADSVMVGHLQIDGIDKDNITSFSKKTIYDLLRVKMGFDKVIITDALSMKAISDEGKAGVKALIAGADILLVPDNPYKLFEALKAAYRSGVISEKIVDAALNKQSEMLKKAAAFKGSFSLDIIGSKEHKNFCSEIAEKAVCLIKDNYFKRKSVYYFEDGEKTDKLKGEDFVQTLRLNGVNIESDLSRADCVVLASFSRPRAYSGKINLAQEDKKNIEALLSSGKKTAMISFGSPFVLEDYLSRLDCALCCFSDIGDFQIAAAKGFLHKADLKGKMPVELKVK